MRVPTQESGRGHVDRNLDSLVRTVSYGNWTVKNLWG